MAGNIAPNIVDNGLVLYLDAANIKSYPTTGTTWTDLSKSGYTGTLTNGATFDSNNLGSIILDGIDDFVDFTATNPILSNNPFTLSAWLNVKTHSNYGISLYIGGASNAQAAYLGYVTTAQAGTSNSIGGGFYGTNIGSGVLFNSGWHQVLMTYNGTTAIIYIDGTSRATLNYAANLVNTSIRIGRANSGTLYPYNGNVGQVSIYNRVLSTQEILQNYNATKNRYI